MNIVAIAVAGCLFSAGALAIWERTDANRRARLGRLISRYNSVEIANRIVRREVWEGQTEKQLVDSLGPAAQVNRGAPGAGKREVWSYRGRCWGRRGLRVTVEDGMVTGFDCGFTGVGSWPAYRYRT